MTAGYQGEYGSNTERAARLLLDNAGLSDCELQPCRSSAGVIQALRDGRVQLGVYAAENNTGGPVEETVEATRGVELEEIDRIALPIVHCLFARSPMSPGDLSAVFSHPQALSQCTENLGEHCPNATVSPAPDTAVAANWLSSGHYPEDAGVICSKVAGDRAGLVPLIEGFQDRRDNMTTFVLARLPLGTLGTAPATKEQAAALALSPSTAEYAIKAMIALTIFAAFGIRDYLGWSSWNSAFAVSGLAAAIVLLLGSRRLENWSHRRALGGYWKYELTPIGADRPVTQAHQLMRIVHIDGDDDGSLRLRGWREGDGGPHRWENKEVLVSRPGTRKGRLLYEYTNTHDHPDNTALDGVVHLAWNRTHPAQPIARMSGWYTGYATGDVGRISYERIDADTFDRLRGGRVT